MLQDEEEEEEGQSIITRGWTRFDDNDDTETTSGRVASEISDLSTRIGVGIWGGGAGGIGRSESLKSTTSYLGTNLGGFLDSSSSSSNSTHEYGGVPETERGGALELGDASLTPIAEWEEEEEEDNEDENGTAESYRYASGGGGGGREARSTETHQTRSSQNDSHENASIQTATRVIRPFSPSSTSSLYGSGFTTPQPFLTQSGGGNIERSTSTSSSLFLSPMVRRDNSTTTTSWWSRLKQHQYSDIPTATAFEAIRDPTPAPTFEEQQRSSIASDPFSDPSQSQQSFEVSDGGGTNELGLMASKSSRGRGGGINDRSISSNVSEVTATSSILEERMRGMDVVQRIRTGEASEGSTTGGGGGGSSVESTPEITQNPFSDPSTRQQQQLMTPGSVIFSGSQAAAFTPRSESPVPNIPPFPLLPVLLPSTPSQAMSPPSSPRKTRLQGPRPQPSTPLPSISRSGSVKDLVAEIERRNSLPTTTTHTTMSPFASPIPSPTKSTATRARTHGGGGRKVEHGLVKKPKLFVANP
jgi:hypothetical protein